MKLVDQLIVEHMFDVSKTQVITFVESVLSNQKDSREGLFRANLVFTKQGKINCKSISIYFVVSKNVCSLYFKRQSVFLSQCLIIHHSFHSIVNLSLSYLVLAKLPFLLTVPIHYTV